MSAVRRLWLQVQAHFALEAGHVSMRNRFPPRLGVLIPCVHKDVVGDRIPGVMNADEEQEQRCTSDSK
jgi:hypothetical protein